MVVVVVEEFKSEMMHIYVVLDVIHQRLYLIGMFHVQGMGIHMNLLQDKVFLMQCLCWLRWVRRLNIILHFYRR